MRFDELNLRTREEHVLNLVLLELTYRCNLNCFFCYNDLELRGRQLTDGDYDRLLTELAEMQVMFLTLSGGEPLASPSFWTVGRRARELGFVVRVKSNGHATGGGVARRIRDEVDPYQVEVSLHGACAATHDRQTRVPGSFDRLLKNLEEMKAAGLRLSANCTLTRWNEDEVEDMLALADGLGLKLQFGPEVTPRDDGDRGPLAVSASEDGVRRLYQVLAERHRAEMAGRASGATAAAGRAAVSEICQHSDDGVAAVPGKNCGAGASTLTIDPFGNVYPCVQWRRSVGTVHETSIRDVWEGSHDLARVRELNAEAGRIERGGASFCLGLAEEMTGDPLASYPSLEVNSQALALTRGKPSLPVLP